MPHVPLKHAPKLIWHGTKNYFTRKPLVVSFETTLSCNADCEHCDLGGSLPAESRLRPDQFRRWVAEFHPPVIQLSGGEPLLRDDIIDVVRAVKINPFFPYTILVSNAWELTLDKYIALREAGVNQFSLSLDFPDDRHDAFRHIPGLFAHLDEVLPSAAALGHGDVVLNTAITSANVRDLPAIVETARRWGVCLSFSVYTPLRTRDFTLVVSDPDDVKFVGDVFEKCLRREGVYESVVNSKFNLAGILGFIRDGEVPGCKAGMRFFVVRPDGLLNPCSLQRTHFKTQKKMLEDFTRTNRCGGCYVSIRSYVEVPYVKLLWENVSMRLFKGRGSRAVKPARS